MLRLAGVEALPVLIHPRSGFASRMVWPMLGWGHEILAIRTGNGLVLADPTTQVEPFGRLPSMDQDADYLVIDPADARVQHTALEAPESNVEKRRFDLEVLADGGIRGTFKVTLAGIPGWEGKGSLLTRVPKARVKRVKELLELWLDGLEVDTWTLSGTRDREAPLELTGTLRGRAPVAFLGLTAVVRPFKVVAFHLGVPSDGARTAPYATLSNRSEDTEVRLRFPSAIRSVSRWGGRAESAGVTHAWDARVDQGALVLHRSSSYRAITVAAAAFREKVAKPLQGAEVADAPVVVDLEKEVRP